MCLVLQKSSPSKAFHIQNKAPLVWNVLGLSSQNQSLLTSGGIRAPSSFAPYFPFYIIS